jgi:hypothetical protein
VQYRRESRLADLHAIAVEPERGSEWRRGAAAADVKPSSVETIARKPSHFSLRTIRAEGQRSGARHHGIGQPQESETIGRTTRATVIARPRLTLVGRSGFVLDDAAVPNLKSA